MQHIACLVIVPASASLTATTLQVATAPNGNVIKLVNVGFAGPGVSDGVRKLYSIDHEVLVSTGPGRTLSFVATTAQAAAFITVTNCIISGDLIPPP